MRFYLRRTGETHAPDNARDVGYLWTDQWDDWFRYSTLYYLTVFDREGIRYELGQVKIGQFDQPQGQRRPAIPNEFRDLDARFFSLGQDSDYYKTLMEMEDALREQVLVALRDVVHNEELYARALEEEVMRESLMRSASARKVEIQFRNILQGAAELTPYEFSYTAARTPTSATPPVSVSFEVKPGSYPPTNIHVLIGRNGVGKTRLLQGMIRSLVDPDTSKRRDGSFEFADDGFDFLDAREETFANVVSITFSAFDDFLEISNADRERQTEGIRYTNVGLRKRIRSGGDEWEIVTQNPDRLGAEFSRSAVICSKGRRSQRWRRALATLESDPLFGEIEVACLADIEDEEDFKDEAKKLFRKLSSGHKIVLLTITRLVELVEERTLVLMDEPEAHLHPPLLAALIRALSDLLINRNGVALIATHSPVVAQEVPTACVWKIFRHGLSSRAERPEIETFAQTISALNRDVFGHEILKSGFHKMIAEAVTQEGDLEAVLERFDNEIGGQGLALIQAMVARQEIEDGE